MVCESVQGQTCVKTGFTGMSWQLTYLLVTAVKDEDDGSGEDDGDQADGETEDPIVANGDVEVEGGKHRTPQNHIQHLVEAEGRRL